MDDKQRRNAVIGSVLLLLVISGFQFDFITSYLSDELSTSQIAYFEGTVKAVEETEVIGPKGYPLFYFAIEGYSYIFKISGNSYRLMDKNELRKSLKTGTSIVVGTSQTELKQANAKTNLDRILNRIVTTRLNPQTYSLRVNGEDFLKLDKSRQFHQQAVRQNLIWGSVFTAVALVFFGLMIYANVKS